MSSYLHVLGYLERVASPRSYLIYIYSVTKFEKRAGQHATAHYPENNVRCPARQSVVHCGQCSQTDNSEI